MQTESVILAELEYTRTFETPVLYTPHVWRYALRLATYTPASLPFMAAQDDEYPRKDYEISGISINQHLYAQVTSLTKLTDPQSWCRSGDAVYIYFEDSNPPFLYSPIQFSFIVGYSNNGVQNFFKGGVLWRQYKPLLLDVPTIAESTDVLVYSKMTFDSASITLNNERGDFDAASNLFGNSFNILYGKKGMAYAEYKGMMQYYIANFSLSLGEIKLDLKDKRERITFQAPNAYYTKEAYKYITDKNNGKLMQNAYGECVNVPGMCIDETQIYETNSYDKKPYRSFKFAKRITKITRVQVKNTDAWYTIFEDEGGFTEDNTKVKQVDCDNGIIEIYNEEVFPLPAGKVKIDRTKPVKDVRASGVFCTWTDGTYTTGDIVKALMRDYALLNADSHNYFTDASGALELDHELATLPAIGLTLDQNKSLFEWLEVIQNGSTLGFQFYNKFDKFSARLDNPNRPEFSHTIHMVDILRLDEVEVNFNTDVYATHTDIGYAKNCGASDDEQKYSRAIDNSKKLRILNLFHVEKVYETDSLLIDESDARMKGALILENLSKSRPLINNIILYGDKWFDLSLYDIVWIDFSVKGKEVVDIPYQIVSLMQYIHEKNKRDVALYAYEDEQEVIVPMNSATEHKAVKYGRDFIGLLRCQILSREVNIMTGEVIIGVRQCDESELLIE
jgi:hypothetical protein